MMPSPPNEPVATAPVDWHRDRARDSARLAAVVAAAGRRIGWYRLVTFALLVLSVGFGVVMHPSPHWAWWIAAIVEASTFSLLVVHHRRNRTALAALVHRRIFHERAVHRITRDWTALPVPRVALDLADHPYASDLAITGRASLLQLLDVVSSAPGRPTLVDWLLHTPPPAATIRARQVAVRELATRDDTRVELGVLALGTGELSAATLERFVAWCESERSLADHKALVWVARAATGLIVGAILLQAVGIVARPYWLVAVVAARGFRAFVRRRARQSGVIPSIPFAVLGGHRAMFALVETSTFDAPLLASLAGCLRGGRGAATSLAHIERIAAWAEVRQSPMLHFTLDWLLLWDFHLGVAFDEWKGRSGRHVRSWFDALGQVEGLVALANLAHDQPEWTFPDLHDDDPVILEAGALGHPLIADAQRVANDVTVGPPGTFLLITGSNMSGKSTLLRAIGANTVLAQAGGPVCAERFRSRTLRVETSMRIEDSLADGVSLFMAELRRLKRIVDSARKGAAAHQPVLYLFDEMLHGTNSADRRIAARIVLGHLLDAGAIGAVTTHDLSLAAGGPRADAAHCVSFADSIDRSGGTPVLHFDYRLRQGLATSTNALALLDIVGLGAPPA